MLIMQNMTKLQFSPLTNCNFCYIIVSITAKKKGIMKVRVYNFSAGPSMLPLPVLEKAAAELVEYGDSGMSVMEMSHRSKPYEKIITGAEASLRSLMNVPFVAPTEELNAKFVAEAAKEGLVSLKGHRLVGGMRASIYNAMPIEGVKALVEFMKKFEMENK